ncbi:hypothetical protein C1752_06659 [Acaryochloris thomasi RCC1774]|uniref:Cytoskeleton protein RodZ-like C-terminal domain-containing protein n=1 Tax=Acaryochloris thomasi RCC1774 TaxID=1764569 RepID=A0A2W1JBA8_9CYAN|nr:helix-turn-helix domain-containing protein [Acaryochloris thomasi]PZD71380.1 hypothetical protein C1752_06659 [Acaryochloris thomasi RCC1774]
MSSPEFEEKSAMTLGEVGAHLREVRQQQSMDLDEISAQTLIPTRLLTAIEEGRVQDLPELIYTRGMIRRFANTLGLDGAELVASLGGGQAPQKNLVKSKKGASGASLKPIHLYLLYIVVIVAAGSGLSYMINQSALTLGGDSVNAPSSGPSGGEEPAPEAVASPSPKANAPAPKVSSAPLRIDLSVKQDAWIEIFVDGQKSYAGTLTAGTNRTITGQKKLVVRSGNAGGVLLAVNKKPAQLMGKLGAVKEVVIEPENTNQSNQAINPSITAEG